jgi:hypothetical protein
MEAIMREDVRQETSRAHFQESSFISLLSGWAQQGVQSYFATQRVLLDLALRQNASIMHALRDRLSDPRHSPTALLTELASSGMSNLIEAQQVLLNLTHRQNNIVMSGVKEHVEDPQAHATIDFLRRGVDTMLEMHEKFLKIADKQTHNWMQATTGNPLKTDVLVDMARDAMETFVQAQKQFLDVVAEEVTKATTRRHGTGAKKIKKTEVTELARQATQSFIDAQKKLFDIAGQQMNVNLKAVRKTVDVVGPLPVIPFSELTREGVQSFVDAQKAMMNVMTKQHNGAKPFTQANPRRKPVRGRKAKTAHAVA